MSAVGEQLVGRSTTELDRRFAGAKAVADTVCYEGYVLYPYRASAQKNKLRWQFGVLAPPSAGGSEPSTAQTEFIIETRPGARLQVRLRTLQVQQRSVEAHRDGRFVPVAHLDDGDQVWTSFDEAADHQLDLVDIDLGAAAERGCSLSVELPGSRHEEQLIGADGSRRGRVVRRRWPVATHLVVRATPLDGPYPLTRVAVTVDNQTDWVDDDAGRDEILRRSLVAAHVLVAGDRCRFISSLDPPRFAADAVDGCTNSGLFPVLVGDGDDTDVVLASPIILYDHPVVAPESEGDMFDATEIDEILALRVLTLTDEEKREARSTDPRAAAVIDRCDAMGADALDALHGTFRSIRSADPGPPGDLTDEMWWEPHVDASFDPWSDTIDIGGVAVGRGARVVLHPQRRSDAQDFFVDGRTASVAGVFNDVSGDVYLAVAVDDPDADLHQWHGRYLYFHPDEVHVLPPDEAHVLHPDEDHVFADAEDPAGRTPGPRVLVAGVGNIFLGDDGFGVEVAGRLDATGIPPGVRVADFGIRGVHLAYELLDGYDTVVLIDAVSRGDPPGTVSVIEHDAGATAEDGTLAAMDAHGMDPGAVLAMAGDLGATVDRVLVVGCEAADVGDGIGLSPAVSEAVPRAIDAIHQLLASITGVAQPVPDPSPEEATS
ncbi:MAG TPA: hydrogenase maturation protease [Acidimicrobiales bacterium]|nr:hydrogenase maturation protease [Acidimicrobiales bacterium]